MLSKILPLLTAILLTASLLAASVDYAEAKRGRKGAFAAGVALGVLGLSALEANAASRERCYRGPRECYWVRGGCYENRFGDVECESGYRKCERPVYCD